MSSILNLHYTEKSSHSLRQLIDTIVFIINDFLKCYETTTATATSDSNHHGDVDGSRLTKDSMYRVHLLRLMAGLDKLGLDWSLISQLQSSVIPSTSSLSMQYLDLFDSSFHLRSSHNSNSNSNKALYVHPSAAEQVRELTSMMWCLGRMKFDINNQTHKDRDRDIYGGSSSNRWNKSDALKNKILEKVVSMLIITTQYSTTTTPTPTAYNNNNKLKGQSVAMVLKGLSKVGVTWTDFTNTAVTVTLTQQQQTAGGHSHSGSSDGDDYELMNVDVTFSDGSQSHFKLDSNDNHNDSQISTLLRLISSSSHSHSHSGNINNNSVIRFQLSDLLLTSLTSHLTPSSTSTCGFELQPGELVTVLQALAFMKVCL